MFNRILIANRGEIASRIIACAQEMGIETVAIYSEVDEESVHVHAADFSYPLGNPVPAESYLNMDKIIKIALESKSEAIHPGYGFLSENAVFARKVQEAGLIWIGPSPKAIHAVGDKIQAKKSMKAASIPVIPGYHGGSTNKKFLKQKAREIGYPVLIKATAGGGGRGMRIVNSEHEFTAAYESARREAKNAFGNGDVFLEKYFTHIRHIEFQILGDHFGNIVHLNERECSIQRRHQKIIEETPSTALDEDLRKKMGDVAIAAARAVNYTNAGSVEFVLDEKDNSFYFLEINARLQVEHAITEAVTGIDLVRWQLKIAAGQELQLKQEEIVSRGHSFEFRIYAENPEKQFLPSSGKIRTVQVPVGVNIRNDLGISTTGGEISTFYDPMIAKLIVHAETREDAIQKMTWALRNYAALGIPTNITFLREVLTHPDFLSGNTHTDFVTEHYHKWKNGKKETPFQVLLAAALFEVMEPFMGSNSNGETLTILDGIDPHSPWQKIGTWGRESLDVLTDRVSDTLGKGKAVIKKIIPVKSDNIKSSFIRDLDPHSPWKKIGPWEHDKKSSRKF
ncbi:pyruvate carboxylase subunit A [Candidatus Heimdallarchaeota archaeon B3_Heim]|nr:MAG: pyruvate carboxylase subunit A [Candidatus Heimdallarchaeota archaeon B3_Heim]